MNLLAIVAGAPSFLIFFAFLMRLSVVIMRTQNGMMLAGSFAIVWLFLLRRDVKRGTV